MPSPRHPRERVDGFLDVSLLPCALLKGREVMKQKPPGNGVKAKQPTEGNNSREAASGIHERKRGRLLKVPKLPNTQVWRFQGGMGGL